jgi:hypothetical protein
MTGERVFDLLPRREVRRKRPRLRDQPAQIDDALHTSRRGRAGEVVGEDEVHVLEAGLGQPRRRHHRVDQVDGDLTPLEGAAAVEQREEVRRTVLDAFALDGRVCAA